MRKTKVWQWMLLILPALVIMPPLGLVMLWKSPRVLKDKIGVTIIFLIIWAGAGVGALKSNYYGLRPLPVPECGYNIELDSRGRYVDPRILPHEKDIFDEVIKENERFKKKDPFYVPNSAAVESASMILADGRAYKVVADREGIDVEDVASIHRKVSMKLKIFSK